MSALRAAFDDERAWLRACDDEGAVIDRMAGYRDNMAFARRAGNAQAHAFAERLVELAEDRLTMLKVGATRVRERPPAPARRGEPQSPPPEPPARPASAPPRVDDSAVVRQLQEALAASQAAERRSARERDTAARDRDAAEQRARDASAQRDSVVLSQRRTQPPAPAAKSPVGDRGRLSPPATLPSVPTNARPTSPAKATTTSLSAPRNAPSTTGSPRPGKADAPRERLPAVGASMPRAASTVTPPTPTTSPMSSASPAAPADAGSPALTGADLAAFRRSAGLTQVAAAQRLGVTQGTISKAEGNPRTVLGPALQEALRLAAG